MLDLIKWLITGVWPPRDSSDPAALYKWQQAVAVSEIFWAGVLVGVILLSFGLTPFYRGFASAAEVASIQSQQSDSYVRQLDSDILDAIERRCKVEADNPQATGLVTRRIRFLADEYFKATGGRKYESPSCRDLGLN